MMAFGHVETIRNVNVKIMEPLEVMNALMKVNNWF